MVLSCSNALGQRHRGSIQNREGKTETQKTKDGQRADRKTSQE
jgi:hypothetical protein